MIKPDFNDLIGLPFGPGGFDCYSLAREVFGRYGIKLPETNISVIACAQASQQEIDEQKKKYWQRIDKPETPCVLQIFSSNPAYANHLATYIGNGRVIHITLKTRVTIQRLSCIQHQKIEGFYRYVGPAD